MPSFIVQPGDNWQRWTTSSSFLRLYQRARIRRTICCLPARPFSIAPPSYPSYLKLRLCQIPCSRATADFRSTVKQRELNPVSRKSRHVRAGPSLSRLFWLLFESECWCSFVYRRWNMLVTSLLRGVHFWNYEAVSVLQTYFTNSRGLFITVNRLVVLKLQKFVSACWGLRAMEPDSW